MSSFTETALEKKLLELNNSQQSIQTLSLWLIHHRKHCRTIIQVWYKELLKAKPNRQLTFMYLANDVVQNGKKKGPEFSQQFASVFSDAFQYVASEADEKTLQSLGRMLNIWKERSVYEASFVDKLKVIIGEPVSKIPPVTKIAPISKTTPPVTKVTPVSKVSPIFDKDHQTSEPAPKKRKGEPATVLTLLEEVASLSPIEAPDVEDLIKALKDLENSASSDAAVRERIASLPQEVSDISLLSKISDKQAADRLSVMVDNACVLLTEYNGRLSAELEDRRHVARMSLAYINLQKEQVLVAEQRLEEFKGKLARVTQVRQELKSHIQNLPDLTLLPDVTGGLAPLPSAGDLFSIEQQQHHHHHHH